MKKLILIYLMVLLLISSSCKEGKAVETVSIKVNDTAYSLKLIKEAEVKIDVVINGTGSLGKITSKNKIFYQFSGEKRDREIWKYNTDLELEKIF
ncbi:MAG: hypothetical protein KAW12_22455 [Candidatus Aminicenantes bacterium]|nr:hypothetical protein [Candidatus Aminicenantes bacterium]